MSGGALTEYTYGTYVLDDWAEKMESENVILAQQMRDMRELLDAYDYYMSGDTSAEDAEEAWVRYRRKWMDFPMDTVVGILEDMLKHQIELMRHGHDV